MAEPFKASDFTTYRMGLEVTRHPHRFATIVPQDVRFTLGMEDFFRNEMMAAIEVDILRHHLDEQIQSHTEWVPATWWDHFKLNAIKWGNPFFNPDKVKMKRLEFVVIYDVWADFPEYPRVLPPNVGRAYLEITAQTKMLA